MSNPLHAAHYADQSLYETAEVLRNEQVAQGTFRLRFSSVEIARRFLPGQFLMLRIDGVNDPLIGRPLALFDRVDNADGHPVAIDVVYLVEGKMTTRLSALQAGQRLNVWGPLGNGFVPRPVDHLIMVAGGIGQTPFLALAKESLGVQSFGTPRRTAAKGGRHVLCYGARSAAYHAGVDDFRNIGVEVRLASDDGTVGHHGLVTELLMQTLGELPANERVHVVCCGPEPMMEAVAALTLAKGVSCDVSLEEPMACGIGICFTCVAKIRTGEPTLGDSTSADSAICKTANDSRWDYQRTCVEGPVYDARQVVWHE